MYYAIEGHLYKITAAQAAKLERKYPQWKFESIDHEGRRECLQWITKNGKYIAPVSILNY